MRAQQEWAATQTERVCRVRTRIRILAPVDQVWSSLKFFEQISVPPPLLVRLVLPTPERAERLAGAVGSETRCLYRKGYLVKRTTDIEPERRHHFRVVEQALSIGGGIRLMSGSYELQKDSGGTTNLEIETRYQSPWRPRWVWQPIEASVCHAFHSHILRALRREAESRAGVEGLPARRKRAPSTSLIGRPL